MTEKEINILAENIYEELKNFSHTGAEGYLNLLKMLFEKIPEGKRNIKKAPLGYRTITKFWQKKSKHDFTEILNIFKKYELSDEKFALMRKVISKNNNMNVLSIICNLDSVYSIAKNNKFDFRLHRGKEEMEFFIKGIKNFKINQTEVVKERISSLSIAS